MSTTTQDDVEAPPSEVSRVAAKAMGTATFAQLLGKPRRTLQFDVYSVDELGEEIVLRIKYAAIPSKAYDDLVANNPPSQKEKNAGAIYNVDTFAPALISAVSAEPKLSVDEATALYKSPEWSGGEVSTLFINAMRVCNSGLDVPFNARD